MSTMLRLFILPVTTLFLMTACGKGVEGPLGSKGNPVKMFFVPSGEVDKVLSVDDAITNFMTKETGYYFATAVPTSYTAVVESLGSAECDVAWLPAFAYVLAKKKYNVEVALRAVRYGKPNYRGEFVTHVDNTKISSIEDVSGKKVAFTDAASASGFILPSTFLAKNKVKPKETVFAGGHPQAVCAVYMKSVDVACTFEGARKRVIKTFPDIMEKTKIIGYTDWIPNDNVTFGGHLSPEMKDRIKAALIKYVKSEEGNKVLIGLYHIGDFLEASDSDYDVVREAAQALGLGEF